MCTWLRPPPRWPPRSLDISEWGVSIERGECIILCAMNVRIRRALGACAVVVASLGAAREASADILSDCGNIDIQSTAKCSVETSGGCSADCTPPKVEASCAADLEVGCTGQCTATADVGCTGSCAGNCEASCTETPGTFNCAANCSATCEGNCAANCGSSSGATHCTASCQASCAARCQAACSGTLPSASCQAGCSASCSGSCTAQANVNCDIQCQASGFVDCTARVTGGCSAQCTTPSGAIYCNGSYLEVSDVTQCIDDLKNALNITVDVSAYANGSAGCDGGVCTAEGQAGVNASASCDVVMGRNRSAPPVGGIGALGLTMVALARRVRGFSAARRAERLAREAGRPSH